MAKKSSFFESLFRMSGKNNPKKPSYWIARSLRQTRLADNAAERDQLKQNKITRKESTEQDADLKEYEIDSLKKDSQRQNKLDQQIHQVENELKNLTKNCNANDKKCYANSSKNKLDFIKYQETSIDNTLSKDNYTINNNSRIDVLTNKLKNLKYMRYRDEAFDKLSYLLNDLCSKADIYITQSSMPNCSKAISHKHMNKVMNCYHEMQTGIYSQYKTYLDEFVDLVQNNSIKNEEYFINKVSNGSSKDDVRFINNHILVLQLKERISFNIINHINNNVELAEELNRIRDAFLHTKVNHNGAHINIEEFPWLPHGSFRKIIMLGLLLLGLYGMAIGRSAFILCTGLAIFFSPRIIGNILHAFKLDRQ